ncbi:hypothetical protein [Aurantimonas coralicida]|uniref:hypothetical protein n=1 Tax=Aurantimonas coralicida TaxID=182270 RepID=UPI00165D74B0|nr:hypothetical protein [Aurantimonas coralicida]MCC4298496.1 hypothetical protein [Aurantimonas coralicida]MCW7545184.1 hypothetical protein [Aurantimonas litoralis]
MANPVAFAHAGAAIGVMAFSSAVDVGIERYRQRRVEIDLHDVYVRERARRIAAERALAEAKRQLAAAKRLLRMVAISS